MPFVFQHRLRLDVRSLGLPQPTRRSPGATARTWKHVPMKLLDLFCGAGGAAVGYHRAGFTEIVGIDIEPQPHYPFTFIQADALNPPVNLDAFDLIHASPPCQRYSSATSRPEDHPDLVPSTQVMLKRYPHVIENVPGAPIRGDYMLCGTMFGLGTKDLNLRRHRYFEVSWTPPALFPLHCRHDKLSITVTGNGAPSGNRETLGRNTTIAEWREAMDIDWCNRRGLTEAIPPAYTEYLGRVFLESYT